MSIATMIERRRANEQLLNNNRARRQRESAVLTIAIYALVTIVLHQMHICCTYLVDL